MKRSLLSRNVCSRDLEEGGEGFEEKSLEVERLDMTLTNLRQWGKKDMKQVTKGKGSTVWLSESRSSRSKQSCLRGDCSILSLGNWESSGSKRKYANVVTARGTLCRWLISASFWGNYYLAILGEKTDLHSCGCSKRRQIQDPNTELTSCKYSTTTKRNRLW